MSKDLREAITCINEGQKIFGVLHLPNEHSKKCPIVIVSPGFCGSKAGKFRIFVEMAEELASLGIATLRFDYRGSGDSEGKFLDMTIESQVNDLIACLNYLKEDNRLDLSRVGLLGRSLGGMISVLAAEKIGDIKSLVLWAPVFSGSTWKKLFEMFFAESSEIRQNQISDYLPIGIPSIPSMGFLQQFFKVDLQATLQKLQHIPLLHFSGKKDAFIGPDQVKDYQEACKNYHQFKCVELENSDHDFSIQEERKITIAQTAYWFRDTLLQ